MPTEEFYRLVHDVAERRADLGELVARLGPLVRGPRSLPPEIALQLSTALHELEHAARAEDHLQSLVDAQAAPALALNEAGQILVSNVSAAQRLALQRGEGLAALGVSREAFHRFKERLAEVPGPTLLAAHRAEGEHPVLFISSYHHRYRSFLLVALQHHWPSSIDRALEDLFGLSRSEREVLAGLAQGSSTEEIATRRGRALGTVRQQVKTILSKMGASTQGQAATLAAAAAHAMSEGFPPAHPLDADFDDHPMTVGQLLRGGRRVGFRRFGEGRGAKVLFLHGPSFGAGEFPADRRLALDLRLDVHALERPGYGRTQTPGPEEDILGCQLDDALALLRRQRLESVIVLAHEVALIPALALARLLGPRIRGIVSVSAAPPFLQLEQVDAMPAQQAIFIQSARRGRWLARLMIRLLTVRLQRLGPEKWYEAVFGEEGPEIEVMRRSALLQGVISTYSFNHHQQGAGYEADLDIMLRDWGHLLAKLRVPLTLVHGEANLTTPLSHLEIFRQLQPTASLSTLPDEGLTLAVSQPARVWDTVAALAESTAPPRTRR